MSNELTDVRCPCGAESQADSYDAGFIAGSGMCQNCGAALPPKDICTCPSGDGSLRWPCPKHPAVEQAGTNVGHGHVFPRADGVKMRCGGPGLCSECTADASRARAALAQPSLMPPDRGPWHAVKWDGGRRVDLSSDDFEHDVALTVSGDFVEGDKFRYAQELAAWMNAHLAQPSPAQAEQAEAERPEIVATLFTPNEKVHDDIGFKAFAVAGDCDKDGGEFYDPEKLMTVAQHERIVVAEKGKTAAAMLESHRQFVRQFEEGTVELITQRDAALDRVAELEAKLSDPTAVHQWQFSNAWFDDSEEEVLKAGKEGSPTRILYTAPVAPVMVAELEVSSAGQWAIDTSCGRPILTYEGCSVIEGDTAYGVLGLIESRSTPVAQAVQVPQAWLDVQAERRRQITAEGWTPEHDDLYCAAELPRAAAAYILNGANDEAPAIWPFSAKWWKPSTARRDMVKACALALAEIERLDRAASGKEVGHE
ncbi:TPA: hypothetical protein ACRNLS_001617 [Pseudomonas aeruginosa]